MFGRDLLAARVEGHKQPELSTYPVFRTVSGLLWRLGRGEDEAEF